MKGLKQRAKALRRRLDDAWAGDIQTPEGRRRAWWHTQLIDHAFLRALSKNRAEVAPGVWRMNQPTPRDLERLAAEGVRSVLSLRGQPAQSYALFEQEACDRLGLAFHAIDLAAKNPPSRQALLDMIRIFDSVDLPLVIHCKSGADRTGTAATIWRLVKCGDDTTQAMQQLSRRFHHKSDGPEGIQDDIFLLYAREAEVHGRSFRDWVETDYDQWAVVAAFEARTGRRWG